MSEEEEFDPADYSVVVKLRGHPPKPWRWEIYRAGRWGPVKSSPVFFESMAEAAKEGKRPSNACWRNRRHDFNHCAARCLDPVRVM